MASERIICYVGGVEKVGEFLRQFWWIAIVGVAGLVIVGYGLWGAIKPEESVVEIVKSNSQITNSQILKSEQQAEIIVDVAGAVEKPGVYKLPSGSRIGDALVQAGGLAASADREWVAKTINLAEAVKDGGKIFIPKRDENNNQAPNSKLQTNSNNQNSKLININTASVGELDSLAGIGEVRAQAIVDNRPYGSIEELVSKAKIPESVYEKIKDQVSVY